MKRTRAVARLLSLPAVALIAGCDSQPAPFAASALDPQAGAAAVALYDSNHDGLLNATELNQTPGLKKALAKVDTNSDGKVSADEISARLQSWTNSGLGRIAVPCLVTRQGRPLEGVTVQFIPEKFLGTTLPTATAQTDARGMAMPSAPNGSEPALGICPGFYRVEITGGTPPLAPRYNTQTVYGMEVALDADGLNAGPLRIDIQ